MLTGAQVRMARAGLKLRTRDLAASAGVSPNTITRIEADLGANASSLEAVRRALEGAGASFLADDPHSIGVRLARTGAETTGETGMLRPEELNASNDG
ncbi:MAG TPA: helix-turn-helix domain-containing protein [Methylomirabilota bacterium]|nr:helix-turn-helix domain-containing protein [Methylomirabilota bacterium]